MSNKPLSNPNAFTGQSPPWSLTQLDANFSAVQATINDTLTYSNYFVDQSGVANSVIVSIANTLTVALTAGTLLYIKIANTNTAAVTMTVNGLAAQNVYNPNLTALAPNQLLAGQVAALLYDGTQFQYLGSGLSAAFVRTAGEIAAGFFPSNYFFPEGDTRRAGAKGDGVTNDSAAVQAMVNYCITSNNSMTVHGKHLLSSSVNIDRQVDGAAFDKFFRIVGVNGGGFYVTTAINMFDTTIAFTNAPVSQLISFEFITFESSSAALAAYVLNDTKFLRMWFLQCDFDKIKCLLATAAAYIQSYFFDRCNIRRWAGATFFDCSLGSTTFDLKVSQCLMEAGVAGWDIALAAGCSFFQNNMEGSGTSTMLKVRGSQALAIHGNYFEKNQRDVDLTVGSHLGVSHKGNTYTGTTGAAQNVYWGVTEEGVSEGNYSDSKLHNFLSTSKVALRDYAVTAVTNIAGGRSEIPWNVPVADAYASIDQTVTTNTFTQATLGTTVIDTNSNFATSTFTATIPGYYSVTGKICFKAVGGTNTRGVVAIYKNGAEAFRVVDSQFSAGAGSTFIIGGTAEVLLAATDTLQLWGLCVGAGTPAFGFNSIPEATRFSVKFIRTTGV